MAQAEDTENPKTPSSDYSEMAPFWTMINAILGGAEKMRATWQSSPIAGVTLTNIAGPAHPFNTLAQLNRGNLGPRSVYLPQFPNESAADYEYRRRNAPFTNIYADISSNLGGKPFAKTLVLDDKTGDDLKKLAENIDGQGNNLHVFSRDTFKTSLDKGIDWILVDYTKVPAGATLAAERDMGARPYWVHIPAERMLAVYSKFINGREIITHARIYEPCVEQDGYVETRYERVRVLDREPILDVNENIIGYDAATWEIYEEITTQESAGKDQREWQLIDRGDITIGIIPLVPFITGKRDGTSWKISPPLRDLAHMQVEEFQQESSLKSIKELTAFPMLAGDGVTPPTDEGGASIVVPVGPRAVLFAPMDNTGKHGQWHFIEPTGASLTFLAADLEKLRSEMRDLGMQPLATANLTVVTTANVAMKAHSAVQAWALLLKDALEQAWKITTLWLGQKVEPTVKVHTDFGVDITADKDLDVLVKLEAAGVISSKTVREEIKRRGVLSDDFDEDEEEQRLAEQQQGLHPEQAIDPVTGALINPPTRPKVITGKPQAPGGASPVPVVKPNAQPPAAVN